MSPLEAFKAEEVSGCPLLLLFPGGSGVSSLHASGFTLSPRKTVYLSVFGGDEAASKHHTVPGLQTQMQFSSDPPGGVRVPCPAKSWGRSGFLGARGQDHGGGQAVHAQSRDVDLVTAVGGKLRTETQTKPQSEKR